MSDRKPEAIEDTLARWRREEDRGRIADRLHRQRPPRPDIVRIVNEIADAHRLPLGRLR
jgi:hypothetical protein